MTVSSPTACTAFLESRLIASGPLEEVVSKIKSALPQEQQAAVLIFDDATSETVEVDLRGTSEDAMKRLSNRANANAPADKPPRTAGRPKLGVIAREVTLLPRHWEWLNAQPGGSSVALRKLVEAATRTEDPRNKVRKAQEVCYRFMVATAGNYKDFEEATRSLFAGNPVRFEECLQSWPADIRKHVEKLAVHAFPATAS